MPLDPRGKGIEELHEELLHCRYVQENEGLPEMKEAKGRQRSGEFIVI
jgi:hypothetical protein